MIIALEFIVTFIILLGIDLKGKCLNLFGKIFWSIIGLTVFTFTTIFVVENWDKIVDFLLTILAYVVVGSFVIIYLISLLLSDSSNERYSDDCNYYYKVTYKTKSGFEDTTILTSQTELNSYDAKNKIPDCEYVYVLTLIRSRWS